MFRIALNSGIHPLHTKLHNIFLILIVPLQRMGIELVCTIYLLLKIFFHKILVDMSAGR
jgi:hypothetical protein